jgi:hypothetical protein
MLLSEITVAQISGFRNKMNLVNSVILSKDVSLLRAK